MKEEERESSFQEQRENLTEEVVVDRIEETAKIEDMTQNGERRKEDMKDVTMQLRYSVHRLSTSSKDLNGDKEHTVTNMSFSNILIKLEPLKVLHKLWK